MEFETKAGGLFLEILVSKVLLGGSDLACLNNEDRGKGVPSVSRLFMGSQRSL